MRICLSNIINMLEDISNTHDIDVQHGNRVAEIAVKIGRALQFDKKQLIMLCYAAKVHDLGRVGIDNNIISKSGKLTQAQRAAMQEHCRIGFNLLKRSNLPDDITSTVLSHQEHYDGTGYPDRLRGNEIPLYARIVCLADVWDAICTKRPYHEARTKEKALEEINKNVTWFDPHLYTIFLKILREEENDQK